MPALGDFVDQIDKLRGHLQNCINHLEMAKRKSYGKTQQSYDKCTQQANKALYETLSPPNVAIQSDASARLTEFLQTAPKVK